METYIIGITGASGSAYALRISDALLESGAALRVVATDTGRRVLEYETGVSLERWAGERPNAVLEDNADLFSPLASGGARRVRQTARARHAAHRRHVFVRHHPAGGHEGPEAR